MTIVSLHIRFTYFINPTAVPAGTSDVYRVIVYLDRQCNGAAATAAQILEGGAGAVDIQSFNNLENSARFRTLKDKLLTISPTANVDGGGSSANKVSMYSLNMRCNYPVEFSGATGNIAEIRSNNIGVLILSHGAVATGNIGYRARIRYTG